MRYDVELNGGQIGNHPRSLKWNHDLVIFMISVSQNVCIKSSEIYNHGLVGGRIRNRTWHHDTDLG